MHKFLLSIFLLSMFTTSAFADFSIIVPFTAGGVFDKQARAFASYVTKTTNEKVTVENIVGAGSIVGTKALLRTDDNVVLFTSSSFFHNIIEDSFKKEDFRLVGIVGVSPYTLVSNTTKKFSCEDIKDKNKNFFIGTAGRGSASDTASELLKSRYQNITLVTYKGISQVYMDLLTSRIDFTFVAGAVTRDDLHILATTTTSNFYKGTNNWKSCLDLDINYFTEHLVVAKANAPDSFMRKINSLALEYAKNADVKEQLIQEGIKPMVYHYNDMDKYYSNSLDNWKKILK
jgi:tripartite-type tricarboxylate transporter receptor subunit TctC